MVPAPSAHPGISNIEARYFDVDQELAPLRGRRRRQLNRCDPWPEPAEHSGLCARAISSRSWAPASAPFAAAPAERSPRSSECG